MLPLEKLKSWHGDRVEWRRVVRQTSLKSVGMLSDDDDDFLLKLFSLFQD